MSDLGTEQQSPSAHKDAKAQAKAAKAYAKASRPWYKKKRFILPLAVVVIAIIATTTSGGDSSTGGSPAKTDANPTSTSKTAGLGDPVRDGKFEFTVKNVSCGKQKIGPAGFGTKAQGQFCLVAMKVENIGKESQTMFGDNQLMFDEQGRKFSADTEAAVYMGDRAQTLFEEINPGNSINGIVIFDVPKNARPASLELHDSAFSDGVKVALK
ncbi:MAG: DUF4352 domain-containing protein [Nocardioides sp.]